MKRYFCLLLWLWYSIIASNAQVQTDTNHAKPYVNHQKKYVITIEPLQWFNWCLRLNLEARLGDGPGWIQISPTVYYPIFMEQEDPDYYYDIEGDYHYSEDHFIWSSIVREPFSHLKGAGLDLNYKRFINLNRTWYLAGGLSYTYFCIDYWSRQWGYYVEDDLNYYGYMFDYRTKHIHRLGINIYAGYQIPFRKPFVIDLFAGIGYKHAFYNEGKPKFNESIFSYGYRGPVFLTGIRLGFGIK